MGYLNHEWTRMDANFLGLEFDWLSVVVSGVFGGWWWGLFEPRMDTNEHEFFWGLEFDWLSVVVLGFLGGWWCGGEPRMDTNGHEFFWGWNLVR